MSFMVKTTKPQSHLVNFKAKNGIDTVLTGLQYETLLSTKRRVSSNVQALCLGANSSTRGVGTAPFHWLHASVSETGIYRNTLVINALVVKRAIVPSAAAVTAEVNGHWFPIHIWTQEKSPIIVKLQILDGC